MNKMYVEFVIEINLFIELIFEKEELNQPKTSYASIRICNHAA